MIKPALPKATRIKASLRADYPANSVYRRRRIRKTPEKSDVLISVVVSTYLLTHLHHALQCAEHGATKEGRASQAANFAQLRKVLCMDARSMVDASALGIREGDLGESSDIQIRSNVA